MVDEERKEPVETTGHDPKGAMRKKARLPKNSAAEETYWAIQDMIWKTRSEQAKKNNVPLEEEVREELIRIARNNGEDIDIDEKMKREMGKYKELLEHKARKARSSQ